MGAGAGAARGGGAGGAPGRGLHVDVKRGQVDAGMRRLKRLMVEAGLLREVRKRRHYMKPSQQRVEDAKASAKRIARKEFKAKLRWINKKRDRGF